MSSRYRWPKRRCWRRARPIRGKLMSRRRRLRLVRITRTFSNGCARRRRLRLRQVSPAAAPPPAASRRPLAVARGAGQGLRQPLLRRPVGVLGLGRDDLGRDHPRRHDLRLLGRRRSRRRAEEAGSRSRDDQVRDRQPRAQRSLGRREVPPGQVRHAHHPVRGGLGSARSQHGHEAEARHGRDRRPEAHARAIRR